MSIARRRRRIARLLAVARLLAIGLLRIGLPIVIRRWRCGLRLLGRIVVVLGPLFGLLGFQRDGRQGEENQGNCESLENQGKGGSGGVRCVLPGPR